MPSVLSNAKLQELQRQGRVFGLKTEPQPEPVPMPKATEVVVRSLSEPAPVSAEQTALLSGIMEVVKAMADRPTQIVVGGTQPLAAQVPFQLRVTGRDGSGRMSEVAAFAGGKKVCSLVVESRDQEGRLSTMTAVVGDQVIQMVTTRDGDGKLLTVNARDAS
jgi:hypothetical protein